MVLSKASKYNTILHSISWWQERSIDSPINFREIVSYHFISSLWRVLVSSKAASVKFRFPQIQLQVKCNAPSSLHASQEILSWLPDEVRIYDYHPTSPFYRLRSLQNIWWIAGWLEPTCEAAAALKAFSTTSVTRWLVSTFPPTTAASPEGRSMVLSGILMVTGFRQPCKTVNHNRSLKCGTCR